MGEAARVTPSIVHVGVTGGSNCVSFHPTKQVIAISSTIDNIVGLYRFTTEDDDDVVNPLIFRETSNTKNLDNYLDRADVTDYSHVNEVTSVVFDPKHPLMITGSKDKTVKIWLISDDGTKIHRCLRTLTSTDAEITCIAIHPQLSVFVVGYSNKTVSLYTYEYQNEVITRITTPITRDRLVTNVSSIAFHPKDPVFVTGHEKGAIMIYNFDNTHMRVFQMDEAKKTSTPIKSIEFHNRLPIILFCSGHGIGLLSYNPTAVKPDHILGSIPSLTYHAAFHPTEELIIASKLDTVEFYTFHDQTSKTMKTTEELHISSVFTRKMNNARSCGFHRTLPFCFASCDDRVYIFDTRKLSDREAITRFNDGEGMNPILTIMFKEMGSHSGMKRSHSAPPTTSDQPWKLLSNPKPQVGPTIGMFPPGSVNWSVKRTTSSGQGGRKTSWNAKKRVRKTKKYRKRRITYRTRK
jgi:WD40 repeat protein